MLPSPPEPGSGGPQECMFGGEECGGHGRCHVSTDGTPSYCVCDSDYTLSPTMGCVVTACYSEVLDVMCNNGECQQVDGVYKCVCPSDLIYVGASAQRWTVFLKRTTGDSPSALTTDTVGTASLVILSACACLSMMTTDFARRVTQPMRT